MLVVVVGVVGMCIDKTVWDNIRVSCNDIDLIVSACASSFQQEMLEGNTKTTTIKSVL